MQIEYFIKKSHTLSCEITVCYVLGIKRKEGPQKRKLGRNPRIPFSPGQVAALEQKFRAAHYLSSVEVAELSSALSLSETRVSVEHFLYLYLLLPSAYFEDNNNSQV